MTQYLFSELCKAQESIDIFLFLFFFPKQRLLAKTNEADEYSLHE